jgi:hypothetical protein
MRSSSGVASTAWSRRRMVAARGGYQRPGLRAPGLPRAGDRPPIRAVAAPWRALPGPRRRRADDTVVRGNPARFRSPGGRRGCPPVRGGVLLAATLIFDELHRFSVLYGNANRNTSALFHWIPSASDRREITNRIRTRFTIEQIKRQGSKLAG